MSAGENLVFSRVRIATGLELHYAEQGDPKGTPVLFLHGWPDSWFTFSRVLPLLAHDVHAFVPDQRGFGDSQRPDSGYAIEDFAADAVAFLDAVGIDRATLVGHSFGSFVARRVAIAKPERVAKLMLIGTGFASSNPVIGALTADLSNLPDPIPLAFARDFQAGTAYLPLPGAFFERIVAESLKLPARLWPLMIEKLIAYDDEPELRRISAPTLLLWGERDALFSRREQERFAAAKPDARLMVLPETGHCPNWERPAEVAAVIDALMRENVRA
ncbi:MAG: alpha/beta hydrolase [Gammaproteobacteria bacterium]|nr:alpha/beta hydrolase [Gammaproteobacteria bacterium]